MQVSLAHLLPGVLAGLLPRSSAILLLRHPVLWRRLIFGAFGLDALLLHLLVHPSTSRVVTWTHTLLFQGLLRLPAFLGPAPHRHDLLGLLRLGEHSAVA